MSAVACSRILARSAFDKIGVLTLISRQCSGVSSSKFPSRPRYVNRLVTSASKFASSGGFVTCAKSCLKYPYSNCGRSLRHASGVSVPIDPIASPPVTAIGIISIFKSSTVYPNACWRTSSVSWSGW